MTRGRLILSFLLFIALCASIAYWGLQLYDPPLRHVAAPAQSQAAAPRIEAAAAVFGGQATAPSATNFQLRGVIVSGTPRESVAIIAEDGKPPKAYRVNTEIAPGVKVQEVHPQYVVLSDGGALKRVELPVARNASQGGIAARAAPVPSTPVQHGQQVQNAPQSAQVQTAPAAGSTVVVQEGQAVSEAANTPEAASESGTADEASTQTGETSEAADETGEGTPSPEQAAQGQTTPPQR